MLIERWAENDKQAYLSSLATVTGWGLTDQLGAITCPTCLVSGESDFFPLALKEAYGRDNAKCEARRDPEFEALHPDG